MYLLHCNENVELDSNPSFSFYHKQLERKAVLHLTSCSAFQYFGYSFCQSVSAISQWLRAFALEAGRLGFILSPVKPKTLKLVSALTLVKRLAIKCSAEDEINRE